MTQTASLDSVASPELRRGDRLHVEAQGRTVELFARDSQLWARLPDPSVTSAAAAADYEAAFQAAPAVDAPIQLLTGSHHQQAFWVSAKRQGELSVVPAVYLIAEGRLIPRNEAFLNPPDATEHAVRWNSNCIQCHAVAGAPGHDLRRDVFESSVAEAGIACEACHGSGAEHVRAMQNPLTRYRARAGERNLPSIVDPKHLTSERASEVCGRCHSYFFPKQEQEWWTYGFSRSYAPGQELARTQLLLSPEALAEPNAPQLGADAASLFYQDGTIRVGGREHNGLVRSPCYERGSGERRLSCLSCHSLHRSEPDDQLGAGKEGNGACTPCHAREGESLTQHSHHAASSAGSVCYNCHMPHTTYALLGAIRSHRIDSPSFDQRTQDRPNACSLCHLDRSEAWAAERAAEWYGPKPRLALVRSPALSDSQLPAGAVFALTGDAAVRAITAAALGRAESDQSATGLRRQLLSQLANDEYAAVRHIAQRSLSLLPPSPADGAGPVSAELISRLLARRDRRPVTIAE